MVDGSTSSRPDRSRPSRKHPAHPTVHAPINRSVIVFVTVCTHRRRPVLACSFMHDLLMAAWHEADHWRVGRYVVLPDHLHLFCAPAQWPPTGAKHWVDYWRRCVSRALKGQGPLAGVGGSEFTAGSWPDPLWQRDCWDTQLRQGQSYQEKWAYVQQNPVRAGLCENPESWPYQGELNTLMWHD
jgi:REP element-mobilizing transposase RayT